MKTKVDIKTVLAYLRAMPDFVLRRRQPLPNTSFLRLAMTDLSDQPKPESFTLSDGHRLAFRCYRTPGATAAVVLVHGSAGHGGQFHALANALARQHSVDVYALDMRGHGYSATQRSHAIDNLERMVSDLEEVLTLLGADYRHLILGGHSAGGGLVARAIKAGLDPLVSGYVFFAPYLGLGSKTVRPSFGGWVRIRPAVMAAQFLANRLGIDAFADKPVLSFDLSSCPDSWRYRPNWSFNMLMAFGPDVWTPQALPVAPGKPMLAVAGENDQCFFPQAYSGAFAQIAPQTEVRLVENCGHWDILIAPDTIALVSTWLGAFLAQESLGETVQSRKSQGMSSSLR